MRNDELLAVVKETEKTLRKFYYFLIVGSCVQVCLSQLSLGLVLWLGCLR